LFKLAAALGVSVEVRSIKFIQLMNSKFDKSNKCDQAFNRDMFVSQTDERKVWRGHSGEMVNRRGGG